MYSGGMMSRNRVTCAWLLLAVMLGAGVVTATLQPSVAVAQDEGGEEAGAGAASEGQSVLVKWYNDLGAFYTLIFLTMSFCLVALVVMNGMGLRRDAILPMQLVDAFEQQLKEKKYQEAYELAKNDESFLGKVLAAGMAKLSAGYEAASGSMQVVGEEESMKIDHRLSYIALIGTLSPMFGLLGTVDGMVASFDEIAAATASPKPKDLAEGISRALKTTLVGLLLAIPAIAVFNIMKNRVSRLLLEVGVVSEQLMSRFQNVGKK